MNKAEEKKVQQAPWLNANAGATCNKYLDHVLKQLQHAVRFVIRILDITCPFPS